MYTITAGRSIDKLTLREFRTKTLDRDDVFQPAFYRNLVFYGSNKADVLIEADALDELAAWNVKTKTFVAGNAAQVTTGPYVFHGGKTWQPWRVYYDINACFMTSFKPSPDGLGR